MKFIKEDRERFGDNEFRLVVVLDDGTRIEGEWATGSEPSIVSEASIKAESIVEENKPGPGYMLFDPDCSGGDMLWPALMRYEPVDEVLHTETAARDEDEDTDEEDEDEED